MTYPSPYKGELEKSLLDLEAKKTQMAELQVAHREQTTVLQKEHNDKVGAYDTSNPLLR